MPLHRRCVNTNRHTCVLHPVIYLSRRSTFVATLTITPVWHNNSVITTQPAPPASPKADGRRLCFVKAGQPARQLLQNPSTDPHALWTVRRRSPPSARRIQNRPRTALHD